MDINFIWKAYQLFIDSKNNEGLILCTNDREMLEYFIQNDMKQR